MVTHVIRRYVATAEARRDFLERLRALAFAPAAMLAACAASRSSHGDEVAPSSGRNSIARKADLHIHTEASGDAVLKPEDIFRAAKRAGLHAVAITDHDSLKSIAAGIDLSRQYGVHFLPGIELSCSWQKRLVHLLAYLPRGVPDGLERFIDENIHAATRKTAAIIIARMAANGIDVTVAQYNAEIEAGGKEGSPLCRLLIKKGIVRDVAEYSARFNTEEYRVTECTYPEVTKIIKFLKKRGSLVVLAHPGVDARYGFCDLHKEDIFRFAKFGLDGVEVYHPLHSDEDAAKYAAMADKLNLGKTGGSDCHGCEKPGEAPVGSVFCNWDEVEKRIAQQYESTK